MCGLCVVGWLLRVCVGCGLLVVVVGACGLLSLGGAYWLLVVVV